MESPLDINKDPNTLQRRAIQKEQWNNSETARHPDTFKNATKVNFPYYIKFLNAATKSDYEDLTDMIFNGIDINCCNFDGLTALHQAVIDDNYDLTKYLIENGANVNVLDRESWTPLHVAAQSNNLEIAEFLINNTADLSILSCDGELAFDVADKMSMKNFLAKEMTIHRISFEATRQKEEKMMLKDATMWLDTNKYRPPLDEVTRASPLHIAAAKNYFTVIKILLQISDVDVNARDCDGWTPLHAASHWGQRDACEILMRNGADMDAVTLTGQSVFDTADDTVLHFIEESVKKEGDDVEVRPKEQSPFNSEEMAKRRSSITRKTLEEKQLLHQKLVQQEQNDLIKSGLIVANPLVTIPDEPPIADNTTPASKSDDSFVNLIEGDVDVILRDNRRNIRRRNPEALTKRLSAVLAPSKSDEKEVQRHQRSRASRASRRSTQGISLEDINQAVNLSVATAIAPNSDNEIASPPLLKLEVDVTASKQHVTTPTAKVTNLDDRNLIEEVEGIKFTSKSTVIEPAVLISNNNVVANSFSPKNVAVVAPNQNVFQTCTKDYSSQFIPLSAVNGDAIVSLPIDTGIVPPEERNIPEAPNTNDYYKALYHKTLDEKLHLQEKFQRSLRDVEKMRTEVNLLKMEKHASMNLNNNTIDSKISNESYQRLLECNSKIAEVERLTADNVRIRNENMALVRVVSRLSEKK